MGNQTEDGITDTRFRNYLKAFTSDWLSRMCGAMSVPFAAIAVWSQALSGKLLWTILAVAAFLWASYRVWRKGVENLTKERNEAGEEIAALKIENLKLRSKPYNEELERQGKELIARLSPEGRALLRHLVTHEPIELGRRFIPEISQEVQDNQMSIAYGSGIVRHDIVRSGTGMIVRQDYVLNPQFRPVLEDLLFTE